MIIITKYKLVTDEKDSSRQRVKSEEKSICPICLTDTLKVIGSRNRMAVDSKGEFLIIVIRRLRCLTCKKIHHELPDILVPYKRYLSKCIEAIIEGQADKIACESSTISRLMHWFKGVEIHIKGSLASISARVSASVYTGKTHALEAIKIYVGEEAGWLARAVRIVVNTNNWVHTRLAFMT
jgi:hypothetical protein